MEQVPGEADAQLALSRLLLRAGRLREATEKLVQVTDRWPDDPQLIIDLATLLTSVGENALARQCLEQPALTRIRLRTSMRALAHVHHRMGNQARALAAMQQVTAEDGNLDGDVQPQDVHFLGLLQQFVGHIDAAETTLDDCLHHAPGFGMAALTRSRLRRQTSQANHVTYLHSSARRATDERQLAAFQFALFKELNDLERDEEAWPALEQANAIMHRRNPYDEAGDVLLWQAAQRFMDATACQLGSPSTTQGPQPIFIVGMPRSGTTLLERMLGNHPDVASAGEIADFFHQWRRVADIEGGHPRAHLEGIRRCARIDHHQLGAGYLAQTAWRANGRGRLIDKMPNNFQFVGMIRRALPQARILHVVREPMAVCFSNFKAMLGDASAHCYEQRLLARFYLRHESLRRHWHRVAPGAMLDVSYASLVCSPHETMKEVLDFCQLPFDTTCVDPSRNHSPVATPSSAQVQGRIHQRGVHEWKRYAAHLEPMRQALEAGVPQE